MYVISFREVPKSILTTFIMELGEQYNSVMIPKSEQLFIHSSPK